jgi:hypothetical protein
MTTRIHVVNFGPDKVEVQVPGAVPTTLHPLQYTDQYVYDGHDVTIIERKPDAPGSEKAAAS